jgi:hypothetical protein
MDDVTAEKIARNNSVFRAANDDIEAAAIEVGLPPEDWTPFICECSDAHCVQIVRLTLERYRHVRSNPRWFVHAIGHETEIGGAVRPLEHHDDYTIVEKIGLAGDRAAELASEGKED